MENNNHTNNSEKGKRRGCFTGCVSIFVITFTMCLIVGVIGFVGFKSGKINSYSVLSKAFGLANVEIINLADETYLIYIEQGTLESGNPNVVEQIQLAEFSTLFDVPMPGETTIHFYATDEESRYDIEDLPDASCKMDLGRNEEVFFVILEAGVVIKSEAEINSVSDVLVNQSSFCRN